MAHLHKCCQKQKLRRGLWSPDEDEKLLAYITEHGPGNWSSVPTSAGIQRCGKSCRLRWINYLRPDLKRGSFSPEEEKRIVELHGLFGNKWSKIACHLPGRTDNEIKNLWNSCLKRKVKSIDNAKKVPINQMENEGKTAQAESFATPCIASKRSTPKCTPWPIFLFSQDELGNIQQSKRELLSNTNNYGNALIQDLNRKAHNGAHNMLKQEHDHSSLVVDQASDQMMFSIDQFLYNNDFLVSGSEFKSTKMEPIANINSIHSQDIRVLQTQNGSTHQDISHDIVYLTPTLECTRLIEGGNFPWATYVNTNAFHSSPSEYSCKEETTTNSHHNIITFPHSLEKHCANDLMIACHPGMHYNYDYISQLHSMNQSSSTTCSHDSSTSIPSLLDYQDVNILFEEAYQRNAE